MKKLLFVGIISTMFVSTAFSIKKESFSIGVGSTATDIEFTSIEGKKVKISDFAGKKVALVFLPSTSGLSFRCKAQACSIKAGFDDLADYDIQILCISADSLDKLKKFIKKNELTFPVLHGDKYAMMSYRVNALIGIHRHTFLIDEKGIIVKIITDVDVDNHAQQIIDGFDIA